MIPRNAPNPICPLEALQKPYSTRSVLCSPHCLHTSCTCRSSLAQAGTPLSTAASTWRPFDTGPGLPPHCTSCRGRVRRGFYTIGCGLIVTDNLSIFQLLNQGLGINTFQHQAREIPRFKSFGLQSFGFCCSGAADLRSIWYWPIRFRFYCTQTFGPVFYKV